MLDIVSTCLVLHSLCKFLVTNSMVNGNLKLLQCAMTHYKDHVLQGKCRKRHSIATAGLLTLSSLKDNAQETYELCKQEAAKEFQIAMPSRNKSP